MCDFVAYQNPVVNINVRNIHTFWAMRPPTIPDGGIICRYKHNDSHLQRQDEACNPSPCRFPRRRLDRLQRFSANEECGEIFLGGGEVGGELVGFSIRPALVRVEVCNFSVELQDKCTKQKHRTPNFRVKRCPFDSSEAAGRRQDLGNRLPQMFQPEGFADDEIHVA